MLQGVSKKLSFGKLSIWRSCCKLERNTSDICGKSANAQFGKTQFFFRHPVVFEGFPYFTAKSIGTFSTFKN